MGRVVVMVVVHHRVVGVLLVRIMRGRRDEERVRL